MTDTPSLNDEIRRVVVLGHSGFIGGRVTNALRATRPDLEIVGFSLTDLDLTNPNSADIIAPYLSRDTGVIMSAAIKRQLGDNPDIYMQNTALSTNVTNLIRRYPVRRVVYLSSTAVYGEDVECIDATEQTPVHCRTYYGLSKYSAEWMLMKEAEKQSDLSVGLVRLPTVYGPGDPGTTYGPSGFLNAAVAGRPIPLQGDGSELREFVYVDDVTEMLVRYLFLDHRGPINLVTGSSRSYLDAITAVSEATGTAPEISRVERKVPKADATFDATLIRSVLPDLTLTSLTEGVRKMHAASS